MRTVVAPDGRTWKVGREWLPYRVRLRRRVELPDAGPLGDLAGLADFSLGGIIVALAIVILTVVLLLVVWPLVALAAEVVVAIVLFLGAMAGRLAFRRPWRVVARTRDSVHSTLAWNVVGWRESGRAIGEVADALAAGQIQPRPDGAERVLLK